MLSEFKQFALRGNVIDMAVGIIIGAAFGTIVNSFVNDILMPPLGLLTGGIDFSGLAVILRQGSAGAEPVTINYGVFINNIVSFVIVAFAIFLVIRWLNQFKKQEAAKPSGPSAEVALLTEIRDILRKSKS